MAFLNFGLSNSGLSSNMIGTASTVPTFFGLTEGPRPGHITCVERATDDDVRARRAPGTNPTTRGVCVCVWRGGGGAWLARWR
jgi:hypothetical protein